MKNIFLVRNFPRRPYKVNGFGDLVQMDLMELPVYNGFKYALIVIDTFSRHLYAEPLKQKTALEVGKAFQTIHKQFQSPIYKLETDKGQEFLGNKKLFKKLNIYFHTKTQTHKANFCEAAIAIIKRKLYMTLRGQMSQDWPKYLASTIKALNERHIKSLGFIQPKSINSEVDDVIVREAQKANNIQPFQEPSWIEQNKNQEDFLKNPKNPFPIGSYVYVDLKPTSFDKSYDMQISLFFIGTYKFV